MISPKFMMFAVYCMIIGKVISMGVEGVFWDSNNVDAIVSNVTGFDVANLNGIGGVVMGGVGLLTHTLPQCLAFDFAFFQSNIESLAFFLLLMRTVAIIVLSGGLIWGCLTQFQSYMIPALLGSGLIFGLASSFT